MAQTETDELIKMAAEEASRWQKIIVEARPFEEFIEKGNLQWLKDNIFAPMEKDMLLMVRGLDFVPNSVAQVAHIKGQLETLDRIEARVHAKVQAARDARQKLDELDLSTLHEAG